MTSGDMTSGAKAAGGTALIVVDVQNDFCEGGSMGVDGGAATAARINELLTSGEHGCDLVVATRDHHIDPGAHFSDEPDFVDSWPPHCRVGTPGMELHPNLAWRDFDSVFDKGDYSAAYSGFEGSNAEAETLADWLRERGVRAVQVCGIATDYCVRATALDAAAEGFETTVLMNLTAAVAPDRIEATEQDFAEAGVRTVGALPA